MHKPPYTRALKVFREGRSVRPRDLPATGVPAWVLYEFLKPQAVSGRQNRQAKDGSKDAKD